MLSEKRAVYRAAILAALLMGGAPLVAPQHAYAQDEWDVQGGDKRKAEIIRRYKLLLENNPTEGMFFNRLLQETGKGAGLDKLIEEYQSKAKSAPKDVKYWLILGHLLKAKAKYQEAFDAYNEAVTLAPDNPLGYLGRGATGMMLGKNKEAGEDFERALKSEKSKEKKQEILRKLADIAFASRDWEAAERYYDQLIELDPRNDYLRMEYAQVLIKYKRYEKALVQYEVMVKLAGGNVKARATTLRDLGELYERMGDDAKALETYAKAQSYVRSDNWLYREVEQRIIGVYRRMDKLDEYLEQRASRWKNPGFDEAMILAGLYDELGREDDALKYYELAKRKNSRNVDPRVKIIQILQRRGQNKEVVKAYEELIRVDGSQARYQFDLAKLHLRNGDNKRAEAVLAAISRKFRRDADVMVTLADTYMRVGLKDEALKVYKDLVAAYPKNDSFIVSLGEYYYQNGDIDKAIATWRKVLNSNLTKSEANARLGQVLVEHNMLDKGISYLEKAAEQAPKERETLRALANAYEAGRRWDEAISIWERLLESSEQPQSASEARGKIIALYQRQSKLRPKMREFEQRFKRTPPDLEAGYFLAEGHIKLGERAKAEEVYRQIVSADGVVDKQDVDALTELEKLYTQQGKNKEAIEALEKLAELRPLRAKEYYYRIAELSLKVFDDEQAVRYAQLALEKNPDDAAAHARLGAVYAKMQRIDDAIKEFRLAVEIDPRAFENYLALAELLLGRGDKDGAKALYRDVAARAMDEQMILMSGRKAMSLSDTDAELELLEAEIGPLVFRSPPRPVYRRLMLELYGRLLLPLAAKRQYSVLPMQDEEQRRLDAIANRAFPVLMDALTGEDLAVKHLSIKMLGDLRLGNAALALGRMVDDAREPLRLQAAIAAARIGDARAAQSLLRAAGESEPPLVRLAALWALGSCGDKSVIKPLAQLLESGAQSNMQALAALALGRIGQREALPYLRQAAERAALNRYSDHTSEAILWSLGLLKDETSVARLRDALERGSKGSKQVAAFALAQINAKASFAALLGAYWSEDVVSRQVARDALRLQAHLNAQERAPEAASARDVLLRQLNSEARFVSEREGRVRVEAMLEQLRDEMSVVPMSDASKLLARYQPQVQAALVALSALPEAEAGGWAVALQDLSGSTGALGLGGEEVKATRVAWLKAISGALRQELTRGDRERVRASIQLLGELADPQDLEAILGFSRADRAAWRGEALLSLSQGFANEAKAQRAMLDGLQDNDYMVRVAAATALTKAPPSAEAAQALGQALNDGFDSVRIAAAKTLGAWRHQESVNALGQALEASEDVAVKSAILGALHQIGDAQAKAILAPYLSSSDLNLRRAAAGEGAGL